MAEGMRHLRVAPGEVADIAAAKEKRDREIMRAIFAKQQDMLAIINELTEPDKDRGVQQDTISQKKEEEIGDRLLGELKAWIEMSRRLANISPERLADYIDEQLLKHEDLPKAG